MIRTLAVLAVLTVATGAAAKHAALPSWYPDSADYRCADGRRIELLFAGGDSALLTIAHEHLQLKRPAPDQPVYNGAGWSWRSQSASSGTLGAIGADGQPAGATTTCSEY